MSKQKTSPQKFDEMQGEGNYTAAKEYDDATSNFVKMGKVDKAARNAKPKSADEERQMLEAEDQGRARSKDQKHEVHIPEPNTSSTNPGRNPAQGR